VYLTRIPDPLHGLSQLPGRVLVATPATCIDNLPTDELMRVGD
jgi:hypothetical protein